MISLLFYICYLSKIICVHQFSFGLSKNGQLIANQPSPLSTFSALDNLPGPAASTSKEQQVFFPSGTRMVKISSEYGCFQK